MRIFSLSSENVVDDILSLGSECQHKSDVPKTLEKLATHVAKVMGTDVCSIYLIDGHTREIVLRATYGLNTEAIGRVKMAMGEGLVGKTLEWLRPVSMASGRKSKQFKYFPETGEEKFSSFLSVPLVDKRKPLGVLVVQNEKPTRFSTRSAQLLMTLALPTIKIIEKASLIDAIGQIDARKHDVDQPVEHLTVSMRRRQGIVYKGIGASPGIAMGPVHLLKRNGFVDAGESPQGSIAEEKQKVENAFKIALEDIDATQERAKSKFGLEEVAIFDAYKMILESEAFREQILSEIDKGKKAKNAINSMIQKYTEEISLAEDDYIRERAYDIQDMGRKLTEYLDSKLESVATAIPPGAIILSEFWSISDFVNLDIEKAKGILCPSGGASSHIAILAESLGLPAVLGLTTFADVIHEGDMVIIDGSSGMVIVNPDDRTVQVYLEESRQDEKAQEIYRKSSFKHVALKGSKRKISVGVNVGMLAHVKSATECGADEIGLYRTEFPFLIRKSLPTEEEQYVLYKKVLELMKDKPVTIRTLDIGGDKNIPYLNLPKEGNPFLGWRSIRFFLEREDLFRIQLRALYRASAYGKLKILFPMISAVDEIRRVKEILTDVKKELAGEGYKIRSQIPIGIMIEVPSAVEMADFLIKEVQFFSIGTNDLTQYTLAVDRGNPKVASLYNPLHPAVLRLIKRTADICIKHKKQVSVCGEMAGHVSGAVLLVGMGIDHLSMSAPLISKIKTLLSRVDLSSIKKLSSRVLALETTAKVEAEVEKFFKKNGLKEFLHHPVS